MKIDFLLPTVMGLQLTGIHHQEKHITLSLTSTHPTAHCPVCGNSNEKIHSRYQRRVADLPWSDKQVQLHLNVRRFFCQVEDCPRKVFSERLHPAIAAWARRTSRLDNYLQTLALKVGGEGAALLCHLLNIHTVSADTVLNLSRRTPLVSADNVPKIVGIDEWAIREGHTYATIIVDLETRRPIELLADAELATVEAWFKEHPQVKIISRDRDSVFAEAAKKGAPNALQVADRWHLLKNLGDAVKRLLDLNPAGLRATAAAIAGFKAEKVDTPQQLVVEAVSSPHKPAGGRPAKEVPTKSDLRHKQVKELQAKGWSMRQIGKHLKMHRQTVRKYMHLDKVPKKQYPPRFGRKSSLSEEQLQYLAKQWRESKASPRQLWRELKETGYRGSVTSVYRAVAYFPAREAVLNEGDIPKKGQTPLSALRAMWLLVKPEAELSERKQQMFSALLEHHPQAKKAYPLIQRFVYMVKQRQHQQLDEWLKDAKESSLSPMVQLAAGIQRDYQVVKAGLSMQWSNGQVEGQINRLKLIKRQAYGRAKLDLLKKRVFYKPTWQAA